MDGPWATRVTDTVSGPAGVLLCRSGCGRGRGAASLSWAGVEGGRNGKDQWMNIIFCNGVRIENVGNLMLVELLDGIR